MGASEETACTALAAVATAAWRWSALRPAADPAAALAALGRPGALPARVVVAVRPAAAAVAAGIAAGVSPSAALALWCADVETLAARLAALAARTAVAVEPAPAAPADPVAALLGALAAATPEAVRPAAAFPALAAALAGEGSTTLGRAGSTALGGAGSAALGSAGPTALGGAGSTALGGAGSTALGGAGPTALGGAGSTALGGAGPTALGGAGPIAPAGPASGGGAAAVVDAAALDRAAAAWSARRAPVVAAPAAAEPAELAAARIAVLAAERDLLADALAEVQAALRARLVDAATPACERIDLAAHGPGPAAFYDREDGGGRPFRWFGRAAVAEFETLVPRRHTVRVTLSVEIEVEPGAAERLELRLDGDPPDGVRIAAAPGGGVRLVATFAARGSGAPGRLSLAAPERRSPPGGDRRTLSVGLSAILVEEVRAAPPAAPAVAAPLCGRTTLVPGAPLTLPVRLPAGRPVRVEVAFAGTAGPLAVALNGIPAEVFFAAAAAGTVATAAFVLPAGGPAQLTLCAAGGPLALTQVALADGAPQPAAPPPAPQILSADGEGFVQAAFYGLERTAQGVPFRWLGRADEAALSLDGLSGRVVRVEAHLAHAISEAALEGFVFGFDRGFADSYDVRREAEAIVKGAVLDAGAPEAGWNRPLRLSLAARVKEDLSAKGDPRTLAVAVAKLVVTPL